MRCNTAIGSVIGSPPRSGTRRRAASLPERSARPGLSSTLGSSTTIRVTSGAASKMAASTAPCRVAAEDGHPSQLPRSRSLTAPKVVVDRKQLHVSAVPAEEGSDGLQRSLHPDVERVGVQALHQQEAGDQLVGGEVGDAARATEHGRSQPSGPARRRRGPTPGAGAPLPGRANDGPPWPAARSVPARSAHHSLEGSGVRALLRAIRTVRPRGPSGWGSGLSSAPCPCPGTCGRRRAGRGRSCVRIA